ncbi:MAG: hypothetical protein FJ299_10470 [Planctomycetes bacterium]|nr:hypothetical protein [Planctomycetota bacterium]
MHRRDWLEVGLLLFGLVLCIHGAMDLLQTALFLGTGLFSGEGWTARLMSSGIMSLVVGLLLLRVAASLARRFAPEPSAIAPGTGGPALQVGLQLLGVYVCVTTLPTLTTALIEILDLGVVPRPLPDRPVDAVFAIASRWSSLIGFALQFAAGIWIARGAAGLAAWLQRPRGATAGSLSVQPTTRA